MKRKPSHIEKTRRRYERVALFYDLMESPMEGLRFSEWRTKLRDRVTGRRALEAGVGTEKNIPYHPPGVEVFAIDISRRMLRQAKKRATTAPRQIPLEEMDVQTRRETHSSRTHASGQPDSRSPV